MRFKNYQERVAMDLYLKENVKRLEGKLLLKLWKAKPTVNTIKLSF